MARITVSDALHDALQERCPPDRNVDTEAALRLCATLPATGPFVVLTHQHLDQLTARCHGFARPGNADEVLAMVDRLAGVRFGDLRFAFGPGQLAELQMRADREGMAVAEYTLRVLKQLTSQFFQTPPARDEWPHYVVPDADPVGISE